MVSSRQTNLIDYFEAQATTYYRSNLTYQFRDLDWNGQTSCKTCFYYLPQITPLSLNKFLAQFINPMDSVAAVNKKGQNAFHYLLKGPSGFYPQYIDRFHCIIFNPREQNKFLTTEGYSQEQDWFKFSKTQPQQAIDRINRHIFSYLDQLLSVFPDTTEGYAKLFYAFHQQELDTEDSVLHGFAKGKLNVVRVLPRIKKMSLPHKIALAKTVNKDHKTPMYYFMQQAKDIVFDQIVDSMGEASLRAALTIDDQDNETLLHAACRAQSGRLTKLKMLCALLTHPISELEAKEDSVSIPFAFQPNKAGATPLHLFCQLKSPEAKEDIMAIETIIQTLGSEYATWVSKQNVRGNTPLHEAVQIGSPEMTRILLSALNPTDKETLLLCVNKSGENSIHLALKKGNNETLGVLMHAFVTPGKLFDLLKDPQVKGLVETRGLKAVVALFSKSKSPVAVAFERFMTELASSFQIIKLLIDYDKQFSQAYRDDLALCLAAKWNGHPLPKEDIYLIKDRRYLERRKNLVNCTRQELMNCRTYFLTTYSERTDYVKWFKELFIFVPTLEEKIATKEVTTNFTKGESLSSIVTYEYPQLITSEFSVHRIEDAVVAKKSSDLEVKHETVKTLTVQPDHLVSESKSHNRVEASAPPASPRTWQETYKGPLSPRSHQMLYQPEKKSGSDSIVSASLVEDVPKVLAQSDAKNQISPTVVQHPDENSAIEKRAVPVNDKVMGVHNMFQPDQARKVNKKTGQGRKPRQLVTMTV